MIGPWRYDARTGAVIDEGEGTIVGFARGRRGTWNHEHGRLMAAGPALCARIKTLEAQLSVWKAAAIAAVVATAMGAVALMFVMGAQ